MLVATATELGVYTSPVRCGAGVSAGAGLIVLGLIVAGTTELGVYTSPIGCGIGAGADGIKPADDRYGLCIDDIWISKN